MTHLNRRRKGAEKGAGRLELLARARYFGIDRCLRLRAPRLKIDPCLPCRPDAHVPKIARDRKAGVDESSAVPSRLRL